VLGCGLGDLFTILGRLDDFFDKNKEYTSVRFWLWNWSPKLAKELVEIYSRSGKTVTVMCLDDMKDYILGALEGKGIGTEEAKKYFLSQNSSGEGINKYREFINRFFPNMEQWLHMSTYEKNKATFPFKLEVEPFKSDKPFFVVHPYSVQITTEKEERKWKDSRWAWLLRTMVTYYDRHDIYIIGSAKDKIENNMHGFPKECIDLRGKSTLEETIALIYGSDGVVGTNSWPTLVSAWGDIPTYSQWFVQEQLLQVSYPRASMPNLVIDKMIKSPTGMLTHPTGDLAWEKVRKVL